MIVKNRDELEILRRGGKKLAAILHQICSCALPGTSAAELNALAEKLIIECGGAPSFKGYKILGAPTPYPGALCISVNNEVVHGLPTNKIFRKGDVVGLDIGMKFSGFYTDTAATVMVGSGTNKLIEFTRKALDIGIKHVKAGARIGDIGFAIQHYLESGGFGVIRELVGHGVGRHVHEDPEIPNWGNPGTGIVLVENQVIAIEPMASDGDYQIKLAPDGWTWLTKDGSYAAHFEHTLIVTKTGADVLTKI